MIHHSNPTCGHCGMRHSAGNQAECVDCLLYAQTELEAENGRLAARVLEVSDENNRLEDTVAALKKKAGAQ